MSERKEKYRRMDREAMRLEIIRLEKELAEVKERLAKGFNLPESTAWMLDVAALFIDVCKILSNKVDLPIVEKE